MEHQGPLSGKTVGDVASQYACGVAQHPCGSSPPALFPPSDRKLEPGDNVVLQGPFESLDRLKQRREASLGRD
ncbi:MAG: hypothetical protein ACYTHJ_17350 [Planctomycetota bacterium]|jgi:hypothetical protein